MGGKYLKIGVLAAVVVGMVSCNKMDNNNDEEKIKENETAIEKYVADSSISVTRDPQGFYYKITPNASGVKAAVGEEVTVKYDMYLLNGSRVWTSKKDTVTIAKFPALSGYMFVLPAMELTMNLMKTGEKATIFAPFYLGFGNYTSVLSGFPGSVSIPSYSPIRVEMELISKKTEVQQIDQFITTKKLTVTERTSDNLVIAKTFIVSAGDTLGRNKPVKVKYVGKLMDGTVFDEGKDILTFTTGSGNNTLITGFDRAIRKMKVNEKATIILPSATAYGKNGRANTAGSNFVIKPYQPITFEVEVQP
ncbi:FKBP-type peptidyl-prolyl cis-trans isomerase [Dyadobacter sp. CY312]|uniref:FKBP-type peptidyl-prolyl cis-trans isomerase n=1 Tax=Dyadobacter sp. CY312 TaxID=2907303 RepID=UPI001F1E467F|nr:FKBP-type peptidyl-prolyl cis-trans isomerase [Dyadobacter sp. CY312]MCE7042928.1 FKBP-type peptidyl-prolyl cis-trans isomerase [Dyadobacter sp. CY312]